MSITKNVCEKFQHMGMKKFFVFGLAAMFILPLGFDNVDALRQVAGIIELDLKPGDADTFQWGMISDETEYLTSLELSVEGEGAEFLSFPKTIELQPEELKFVDVTVEIPDDFPGGVTFEPRLIATEFGQTGGATVINLRVLKVVTLNLELNEDSSLWVDWDELRKQNPIEPSVATARPATIGDTEGVSIVSEDQLECGPGTEQKDGKCVPVSEGGGCLIATAAYDSELSPQVQFLREIRDIKVMSTDSGTSFIAGFNQFYYSFSPTIADWERQNPAFKELVKITITPLLTSLSILNYVDVDSDAEMLGYGISIILLNIGMYFVAPAFAIIKTRKYLH